MGDFLNASSNSGASLKVVGKLLPKVEKKFFSNFERVLKDVLKQKEFSPVFLGSYEIVAVPVLSCEKCSDNIIMTMPYIEGTSGENYLMNGSHLVLTDLKRVLNEYLITLYGKSTEVTYPKENIKKKIDSIFSNQISLEILPYAKKLSFLIEDMLLDDLLIPVAPCHGDLTLSNIIFSSSGRVYLIDFLSCEIESPLQDIAKLLQDIDFGWSFRRAKSMYQTYGRIFCDRLRPDFINVMERLYSRELEIIKCLTILRIVPYIKDDDLETKEWFIKTSKTICKSDL